MIQYTINYYLNTISPKGRIAWEYNPLHNFRRTKNTDENGLHHNLIKLYGLLYTLVSKTEDPEYLKITTGTVTDDYGITTTTVTDNSYKDITYRYKNINGNTLILKYNYLFHSKVTVTIGNNEPSETEEDFSFDIKSPNKVYLNGKEDSPKYIIFYSAEDNIEAGSIVDLDTELLNFSLNNPVQIEAQPSYDGSVNLILNDNRNPPRLINTRFSTRQLNTYEIVDRIGDNDTNIYDDDINQFDLDTSLYKKYNKIPKVRFNRIINGGNLKVGNYVLYFRYCDADENETDFVAESGIIAMFKGNDKDPFSIDGGFLNMNTHKSIDVTLMNIDEAYDYIKVYYTRASSDLDQIRQIEAHKITKKFIVSRNLCHIIITGDEETEIIPKTDLTSEYFIAEKVKTQAQCLNMLFLGNVSRPDPLHQDLTDLSIRILPYYKKYNSSKLIGYVDPKTYIDIENVYNNYEYYNTKNIYYNVGYWNEEIYRIGVVYIMYDNTLSKVYNIRGCESLPSESEVTDAYSIYTRPKNIFDEEGNRQYIEVSEDDYSIVGGKYLENARGVVRFADFSTDSGIVDDKIYLLGVIIPEDVLSYLKNYCGIKGLFFVRQKRIPTILAQGLTLPIDPESRVPLIYTNLPNEGDDSGDNELFFIESFISQKSIKTAHRTLFRDAKYREKEIIHDYDKRLLFPKDTIERNKIKNSNCAAILCPEYEINQLYFNQFFTGTDYPISYTNLLYGDITNIVDKERFYTHEGFKTVDNNSSGITHAKLVSVSEEVPEVAIGENIFRGVCGTAQEAYRYRFAFKEGAGTKSDTNLVRGIWHPYLGAVFLNKVLYGKLVNIYIPGYNISELANYYKIRYSDISPYYPIGDRLGMDDISTYEYDMNTGYKLKFFRGDCYLCTFTHRLNRNFLDPSAPANDIIIDKDSWGKFNPEDKSTFNKVNLGDINAVKMGSWYTFKVKSNTNLSIRSLDESHLEEKGVFGLSRGFYPLQQELLSGNNKISDSYNVNDGFRGNFGEKFYLRYPDVPYIKNNFENRILYSLIAVNDAFRNGYRVFKSTHFNDYTKEYGSIILLVTMSTQGLQNGLLCIFEHAIGYIPVNERAVAGEGAGGNVYINTSNVLPDNPRIISDLFGSQWQESIVLTPYFVYGVDTVAKKIWRTNGTSVEVISDIRVNKFLIDNITLSEKELTPIIGIRNVKTHYNANKSDVMFTFYDNLYGIEEKVWNLCWNEITQSFITFYSWLPSYSANIDNIFFSFDRETSKAIAKLGTSQIGSTNADGIVLNPVVVNYELHTELNEHYTEENPIEYVKRDDYSELLIPYYISEDSGPTKEFDKDYKDWIINHTLDNELYDISRGYLKPKNSNLNRWYKVTGNGIKARADFWETIIAHYLDSYYPCNPWNYLNTGQFENIYTPRIETEIIGLENRITPTFKEGVTNIEYEYEILKDPYGNWKYFLLGNEYEVFTTEKTENNVTLTVVDYVIPHKMLKFWPSVELCDTIGYPTELCMFEGLPNLLYRYESSPGVVRYKYLTDNNGERIKLNISIPNWTDPVEGEEENYLGPIWLQDSNGEYGADINDGVIYRYSKRPDQIDNTSGPNSGLSKLAKYETFYTLENVNLVKSAFNLLDLSNVNDDTRLKVNEFISIFNNRTYPLDNKWYDPIFLWMRRLSLWYDDKDNWFFDYNTNKIKLFESKKVWYVYLRCNITVTGDNLTKDWDAYYINRWGNGDLRYNYGHYDSVIAITSEKVLNNNVKYKEKDGYYLQVKDFDCEVLTTDFWKHGQAGIIDIKDEIEPCLWYGKQHPFEFEFVVRDTPNMHKVFDNLEIISNKAEPESFHFEVVGESYEFADDKKNMYYRLEYTKEMWQNLGINTTFDRKYTEIDTKRNPKSTIFPLYYNRTDTYDNIYDYYTQMRNNNRDYRNLSGSEIIRDKLLNEYRIRTHVKNTPIDKKDPITNRLTGRIRGNSHYKEDRWKIQIPSIAFMLKNESDYIPGNETIPTWTEADEVKKIPARPPVVVNYIPDDYPCTFINIEYLPNIYGMGQTKFQTSNSESKLNKVYPNESEYKWYNDTSSDHPYKDDMTYRKSKWTLLDINPWTYRKETKIRDKYIKVRIRYEGSQLAVIQAVLTTYTESYA